MDNGVLRIRRRQLLMEGLGEGPQRPWNGSARATPAWPITQSSPSFGRRGGIFSGLMSLLRSRLHPPGPMSEMFSSSGVVPVLVAIPQRHFVSAWSRP